MPETYNITLRFTIFKTLHHGTIFVNIIIMYVMIKENI